jgi:sortase A
MAVLQDTAGLSTVGMRKIARILGLLLIIGGALFGTWALVVWQWKDPFTSVYTWWEQRQLASSYDERVSDYRTTAPPAPFGRTSPGTIRRNLAGEARRYRLASERGDAVGRLQVPRLGLNTIIVNGSDSDSLTTGPGRDLRTSMPGEGKLTSIAGHRVTFLAPFAHIDSLRKGDPVTFSLPYGTFHYRVTGDSIVPAGDLARPRSRGSELLAIQASYPRFFATHSYIAYAALRSVTLPNGRTYRLWR